jgi:hypothetical protein
MMALQELFVRRFKKTFSNSGNLNGKICTIFIYLFDGTFHRFALESREAKNKEIGNEEWEKRSEAGYQRLWVFRFLFPVVFPHFNRGTDNGKRETDFYCQAVPMRSRRPLTMALSA